jgi:retron-type reverse transcriptase
MLIYIRQNGSQKLRSQCENSINNCMDQSNCKLQLKNDDQQMESVMENKRHPVF